MNNLDNLIKEFIDNIKSEDKEQQKCIDILDQLSECEGFDVNAPINSDGDILLMIAGEYGCLDVVKQLIEVLYANPNMQNYNGITALYCASFRNRFEIIDYLISVPGIDVNIQNFCGNTALHLAVYLEKKESVEALLRSNELDISLRDKWCRTAEELARSGEHHEIADMIAAYEPSISAFDNK